jgi:NADPH:quinone reductase-like Zn-dependent oxidoreductase
MVGNDAGNLRILCHSNKILKLVTIYPNVVNINNSMCLVFTVLLIATVVVAIYFITKKHSKLDFTDKHILITGGSSGIGENLAYLFARLDAHLTIASNQPEDVDVV